MHTTLEPPGNPDDQSVAAAFQLVVPVLGPTQLSVHVGEVAPLGVAVTDAAMPAVASDPAASATAMTILRIPTMMIRSVRDSDPKLSPCSRRKRERERQAPQGVRVQGRF